MEKSVRKVAFLLLLSILLTIALPCFALAAKPVNVEINGVCIPFTEESGYPFIDENNRTMVPLRATMEAAGFFVDYENATRTAVVSLDGITIKVPVGTNKIYVNGTMYENDTNAVIRNNRTYLPIRIVLESAGFTVDWDGETRTVRASRKASTTEYNTIEPGKLTVLNNPDFPPYEFLITLEDGKQTPAGFDIDLAQYIADYMGLELKIVKMPFENIVASIADGKADLAISGITPDDTRRDRVDFSDNYHDGKIAFVSSAEKADEYAETGVPNSKEVTIGVIKNSLQIDYAKKAAPQAEIVTYGSIAELFEAVENKSVNGAFVDYVIAQTASNNYPKAKISFAVTDYSQPSSAALPKFGSELLEVVNEAIAAAKADGSMAKFIMDATDLAAKLK